MKSLKLLSVSLLVFALLFASFKLTLTEPSGVMKVIIPDSEPHQCRFWGMIADSLPEDVVLEHLVDLPYSLKNLGASNRNGWGLAYYNDAEPVVFRGAQPASVDANFSLAAQELAESGARIGVGHVRAATSGASDIPNPHPFIRNKGGKWWAFGHNGGLDKDTLKNLIGPQYLADNPPIIGNNWSDPDVVDSDLYMLYLLKRVEDNNWNATLGMATAITDISATDSGAMNFFLTDSETIWGFRRGHSLYYYCNAITPQYSAIASQPPTSAQDGWIPLCDYNLVILEPNKRPVVIENIKTVPEFSSTITFSLIMLATLFVVLILRRERK